MNILLLAGGVPHAHDFAATGKALDELLTARGHTVTAVDHPDAVVDRLDGVDGLVVHGLWWRMHGDAYDRWRAEHAYTTSAAVRETITGFVRGGGGLVALHTAVICFDDWPGWGELVGGAWRWGVSSHPPYGPVRATIDAVHPVTAGLPETLRLDDEVYGDLAVHPSIDVLATARRGDDDTPQPVLWVNNPGAGRVVFDGFGHDVASIRHDDHARLITQAVEWTVEERQ